MSCAHAYALLCVQSTHVPDHIAAEPQGARTPELAPWSQHSCMLPAVLPGFCEPSSLPGVPRNMVVPVADSYEVPQDSGKRQTVLSSHYRILSGHAASYMPQ